VMLIHQDPHSQRPITFKDGSVLYTPAAKWSPPHFGGLGAESSGGILPPSPCQLRAFRWLSPPILGTTLPRILASFAQGGLSPIDRLTSSIGTLVGPP
jgi:hypothetical protein